MTSKYSRPPTTPTQSVKTWQSIKRPAAIDRLEITIDGVASRTVSAVDDLVHELKTSGMNDAAIRARVMQEVEGGKVLSELRNFATARCPGFFGDMTFRFARDTLAAEQAAADALTSVRQERIDAMEKMVIGLDGEEKTRQEAILETYKAQGIDTTAFEGEELPEPPPDANLEDEYMWVAVEDNRTCDVCSGNHGEINTLGDWSAIGEPRSGACMGDQNCRCILVPTSAMSEGDQKEIRDNGPVNTDGKEYAKGTLVESNNPTGKVTDENISSIEKRLGVSVDWGDDVSDSTAMAALSDFAVAKEKIFEEFPALSDLEISKIIVARKSLEIKEALGSYDPETKEMEIHPNTIGPKAKKEQKERENSENPPGEACVYIENVSWHEFGHAGFNQIIPEEIKNKINDEWLNIPSGELEKNICKNATKSATEAFGDMLNIKGMKKSIDSDIMKTAQDIIDSWRKK